MAERHTPLSEGSSPPVVTQPSPDVEAHGSTDLKMRSQPRRQNWWREELSTKYAEFPFILCSLITGLSDGVSYATFGCFISMQTGNTVILGLGAADLPPNKPFGWLKSLTSITSFFIGSFVFSKVAKAVGAKRRGTLSTSFLIQCLFIIIATSVIQADVVPHDVGNMPTSGPLFYELIPLALLAFGFGGQIAASRSMGFNEIPTIVLTSVYYDIASDPSLSAGITKNVKRNRRIGSVVALLTGAIAAGWLARSDAGMQAALWISAFIKLCIAGAWLMWPAAGKEG